MFNSILKMVEGDLERFRFPYINPINKSIPTCTSHLSTSRMHSAIYMITPSIPVRIQDFEMGGEFL